MCSEPMTPALGKSFPEIPIRADRLIDVRYTITCQLGPGIDPQEWAEFGRDLATINPTAFSSLRAEFYERLAEIQ